MYRYQETKDIKNKEGRDRKQKTSEQKYSQLQKYLNDLIFLFILYILFKNIYKIKNRINADLLYIYYIIILFILIYFMNINLLYRFIKIYKIFKIIDII